MTQPKTPLDGLETGARPGWLVGYPTPQAKRWRPTDRIQQRRQEHVRMAGKTRIRSIPVRTRSVSSMHRARRPHRSDDWVATSIAGPPQAVAITPDGKLAVVSATNRYDHPQKKVILDTFLQVIDLEAKPPQIIAKVDVGSHPQGWRSTAMGRCCWPPPSG